MVLQPVLKLGWTLKGYWRWLEFKIKGLFPGLVEYSRLRRLFNQAQEYVTVVFQRLAKMDSFGLVADGTLVIDQQGLIAFFSVGTEAEVKQLEKILDDLADHWVLGDLGNRGKPLHDRLRRDKQVCIKLTGGKERQWIENVIGILKQRLGLDRIRKVRKMPDFLVRLKTILCAYNLITVLQIPI